MKAMILAAGRGERMRPLTDTCPKPLLKIADKALIEYHLLALQKAGFKEIVINHAWLGEKIEHFLGDGQQYGLSICYSPEQQALETAGGIIQALPKLLVDNNTNDRTIVKEEQTFLVINGDIFTDYNFSSLINKKITAKAHLIMVRNPPQHPCGDFYLTNGKLFDKKDHKQSTQQSDKYTFSGIGLYRASFFAGLTQGRRALAPLLKQAMFNEEISGELHQGLWADVGTPKRLEELQTLC
jgi:N-acetyl-alpha-D-muramate 1-phosphate uridylyltransferase